MTESMDKLIYNRLNIVFLTLFHLLFLYSVVTTFSIQTGVWIWIYQLFWYYVYNLSITCGYHRLFNHHSYDAKPSVRVFFLLFGASAFQNSAINWSIAHRLHHRDCETLSDPYNANKGFWHSHIFWIFSTTERIENQKNTIDISDLKADKLCAIQHKFYLLTALLGWMIPILIGKLFGFGWALLFATSTIRTIAVWHATFCVNSLAHLWGHKPYNTKIGAVQNFIVSLITSGEGWHNYHHTYPKDYRASHSNNNLKYWNPSSSFINVLCWLGLVTNRKCVSNYNKHRVVKKTNINGVNYDHIGNV
jgi:stearoyl-CoA desaturase (Delta-9 desaturase)